MLSLKAFICAFVFSEMKEVIKIIQHIRKLKCTVHHLLCWKGLYKHCLFSGVNAQRVKIRFL